MSFKKPSHAPIRSHRGGPVGQAIVAYKRAWTRLLGPVLDTVLEFERDQVLAALSARMDGVMQALDRRQGAMEVDLIVLSERVRRLERDTGLSEDVRLTNQAILDGREKLAELRAEVDSVRAELSSGAAKRHGH